MAAPQTDRSGAVSTFSNNFYKQTALSLPGKNLIMSPLSCEIALAMLSLGANGQTLDEINRALAIPNQEYTKTSYKDTMAKLNSVKGVTLKVANKVFVKEGEKYVLHPSFKKSTIDVFSAEAENVRFENSVPAAKTINTWVEAKTNDKIHDLILPDFLSEDTRLVLVNAIYFKGNWANKFDKENTQKGDFHLNTKDTIQVDMMFQNAKFQYAEIPEWDAKILELPYEGREMSMVIVLPNKIDGLAALEEAMAGSSLSEKMQRMESMSVDVKLPKFKIETTIDLNDVLPKMGMATMFDPSAAQFEGLLESNEPLVVSKAIQKAFIEVNEEGAEAAAATGMVMMMCAVSFEPEAVLKQFTADRPFFFAILDMNRSQLFKGSVKSKLTTE